MASSDISAQFSEILSSLDLETVPDKLKCAICSKLALNAFKLPCCSQSICESCQSSLPESCPVCEHSPVTPDMCTPHKALRNTIKAYLKTAEKKLAEEKAKVETSQTPIVEAPVRSVEPTAELQGNGATKLDGPDVAAAGPIAAEELRTNENLGVPGPNDPQPSIETANENNNIEASKAEEFKAVKDEFADEEGVPKTENGYSNTTSEHNQHKSEAQDNSLSNEGQQQAFQQNMPNEMGQMSGFPNMQNMMGLGNVDFNQMMQNGMPGMNFPNMMGMSGMGFMDPMAQMSQMSQMYGGFGGPNMGNGMNGMGMNFGNANQGMYGGLNGQNNMWNGQQNNSNTFPHGMGGDFGSNNGYGYNYSQRGNFSQQQYSNNDFQSGHYGYGYGRGGRGRGRGFGRGRGGFNQFHQGNHSNFQQPYNQNAHQYQSGPYSNDNPTPTPASQTQEPGQDGEKQEKAQSTTLDEEFAPGGLDDVREVLGGDDKDKEQIEAQAEAQPQGEPDAKIPSEDVVMNEDASQDDATLEKPHTNGQTEQFPIETVVSQSPSAMEEPKSQEPTVVAVAPADDTASAMPPPSAPLGPAAQFGDAHREYGFIARGRGGFHGRGRGGPLLNGVASKSDFPLNAPTEPKGQGVAGAPTGPKALRSGHVAPQSRGRGGLQIVGRAAMASRENQALPPPSATSQSSINRGTSRSRSRSRSPSRHRSRRHHRSDYPSDYEYEEERRRERKHKRPRYEDDYENETPAEESGYRSGSSAPERSSHRSQHDKSHHSSHKHRSSHRSHRHRSRSPDDLKARDRDYDEDRRTNDKEVSSSAVESEGRNSSHRKHKHRSGRHEDDRRNHHHREHKRSRRNYDDDEDRGDEESEHRSRRQKRDGEPKIPTGPREMTAAKKQEPETDPYAQERAARIRERMLKEQQRREATVGDRDTAPSRKGSRTDRMGNGRRVSYKYADEASASRIEQEREAARWL